MSEWLKEHAWKLIPPARADAHRNALTQFPPTTSCDNDVHRRVPVNHRVRPGFQGVSDTVLTQNAGAVSEVSADVYGYALLCDVIAVVYSGLLNRYFPCRHLSTAHPDEGLSRLAHQTGPPASVQ